MVAVQNSLAIILRWRAYGESDKIVTCLTQDVGKLTGIAKGARRSRRRFANSLEPLARVRMYFRLRPNAHLAFLESCELLQSSSGLTDPTRFAYASYLAELVDQLTVEEHPVVELYALLEEGLNELEHGPATSALLRGFELQVLSRAGYEPQLEHCARCQRPLPTAGTVHLHTAHGTFICPDCRQPGAPLLAVSASVIVQLLALKAQRLVDCRQQVLGSSAAEAAQLSGRLLALHLPHPLRSLKLIEQLS